MARNPGHGTLKVTQFFSWAPLRGDDATRPSRKVVYMRKTKPLVISACVVSALVVAAALLRSCQSKGIHSAAELERFIWSEIAVGQDIQSARTALLELDLSVSDVDFPVGYLDVSTGRDGGGLFLPQRNAYARVYFDEEGRVVDVVAREWVSGL